MVRTLAAQKAYKDGRLKLSMHLTLASRYHARQAAALCKAEDLPNTEDTPEETQAAEGIDEEVAAPYIEDAEGEVGEEKDLIEVVASSSAMVRRNTAGTWKISVTP